MPGKVICSSLAPTGLPWRLVQHKNFFFEQLGVTLETSRLGSSGSRYFHRGHAAREPSAENATKRAKAKSPLEILQGSMTQEMVQALLKQVKELEKMPKKKEEPITNLNDHLRGPKEPRKRWPGCSIIAPTISRLRTQGWRPCKGSSLCFRAK